MIKIEHLKKEFKTSTPLKDVNLTVAQGDIVSIIGPSGTGKSTLLRCINLLEKPTSGHIFIDGEEITSPNADVLKIRRNLGMVFQNFNLFKNKNVLENVSVALRSVLGKSKQEAETEAKKQLSKVGLIDKINAYPDELSGGQQQRVAIARSVAMQPKVLLLDEPTSALDPAMVGEVLFVIKKLALEKMTMLIVTHEFDFAREVSTKVVYLDEGKVYEQGTADQIFDNPQLDKTKLFVNNLKCLHETLSVDNFDYVNFMNKIDNFCKHYFVSDRTSKKVQFICDTITDTLFKEQNYHSAVDVNIVHIDKDHQFEIAFKLKNKQTSSNNENDFINLLGNFSGVTQKISNDAKNNNYQLKYIVNCND